MVQVFQSNINDFQSDLFDTHLRYMQLSEISCYLRKAIFRNFK